jgi:hypothetical protein
MRTYDPADHILYVHLAQDPAVPATPPHVHDECHRLPADYANASLRARIGEPPAVRARPALVLLPGGSSAAEVSAPAAPALRLLGAASGT